MAYTTINKSTDYFNTKLYTGNASTNAITGVGFEPSFTWIKGRGTTNAHMLFDAVRGVGEALNTNNNNAEATVATAFTAFGSDGFTVGNYSETNTNSENYASWNWKANGLGSSNTDGTINSIYTSANTTSGFSIVTYTGNATQTQTVGHGLGVAPKLIIFKSSTSTEDWSICCPSVLGVDGRLTLNTTAANSIGDNTFWNSTAPSSTLFSLGNNSRANASGQTIVAYCFAEKQGFSKFGSYKGLGGSGEPFIYTGFKPAFIITRNITSAVNWGMFDDKRNPFNVVQNVLLPDNSAAETTGTAKHFDFLSNGFKVKNDSLQYNGNNENHIYMAFGQTLVGTNNVPANAR